ncbi:MAG: carboxypeptidase regulatory-like domain-containing protein [Acidobacteriota bacterium]
MKRATVVLGVVLLVFTLTERVARAQSAIAGVVKDSSGALLPGVTVEASSPALIEKVKTAVTNEAGQYRVVDLRPGTYDVSFTLTGFSTVVRAGILLEANFTAPLNVELRVGTVSESVTVTGTSPVVDVQTSQRRQVVSQEMLESIPTGRNFVLMAGTTPAVTTGAFDVGGSSTMWSGGSLLVHGSVASDSRTLIDGMVVDSMFGNGQCSCVYDNEAQTQEMAVQVSGGAAEHQLSGVLVNRIPKYGGNKFTGEGLLLFSNSRMQGDNVDDALRGRGITTPARLGRQYDVNYSMGGPILRDKLWFFASGRNWAYNNYVANVFNADGSQAVNDNSLKAFPARLTWQMSNRNRLTGLIDLTNKIAGHFQITSAVTPEATVRQDQPGEKIAQLKWTSTLTPRLLFEVGTSRTQHNVRYVYQPEITVGTCHTAFALCPSGTGYGSIPHQDTLLGTTTVAPLGGTGAGAGPNERPAMSQVINASLSYVSGAHAFKVGFQDRFGWLEDIRQGVNADLNQLYRSGVPFAVQVLNTPSYSRGDVNADMGIFVQDIWTMKRLTLSPGLRWDHFNSSLPEQVAAAGRFVPERRFAPLPDAPNWNNVVPRLGASYDVSGRGKTAIKGNIGLYVQSQGTGFAMTYSPSLAAVDQRTWTDTNRDDIAQESEIGPTSNLNFGLRRNQNPAPDISRPYQLVGDIGIQHELFPGFGLAVSYDRRNFYNTIWTTNLALNLPVDYTLVSVADPRGNGQTLPVYNLAPGKLGLINELDSNSSTNTTWYQGVDVTINYRWSSGTLLGGTSTGRTLSRTCEQEDPNNWRFCDQSQYDVPLLTQFKLAGTYNLPYGVRLGANFQSQPGTERIINYSVVRAILPTLTQTSVNVRVNEPGSTYNDRVNQLDVTLSKSFRSRGVDVRPELSLFNMTNANPVLVQINTFGPSLGNVTTILNPRVLRIGVNVKF